MNVKFSILVCNPLYGTLETIINAVSFLGMKPQIFFTDTMDWAFLDSQQFPDFFHFLPIDSSQKESWENFFSSDEYAKNPVFSSIQYIFILSKNSLVPDRDTTKILDILLSLTQERKAFDNKPAIFCEMQDDLEYDSLKEKADGVFSKSRLLETAMLFLSVLQNGSLPYSSYLEMFEKGRIFVPEKKHFPVTRGEQKAGHLLLFCSGIILLLSLIAYIFILLNGKL